MTQPINRLTNTGVSGVRIYPAKAAEMLDRKPATIVRWAKAGRLTRRYDAAGKLQVLVAEIEAIANNLPQAGRPAADLSQYPKEEDWLTVCEVAKAMPDKASYATWYNWAKPGGILKTEGTAPRLTRRLWVLRALQAVDKLSSDEAIELHKKEKEHALSLTKKGKRKKKC